jgi:general nucleoside transport system permease protein
VDEVVTTLLFNFIMLLFVSYLLEGPMKDPMGMGWPKSEPLWPRRACRASWTGCACTGASRCADRGRDRLGDPDPHDAGLRDARRGAEPRAARFAGMPVNAVMVKTALLSGGLAALAGWSEVAGLKGHLSLDLSPGFGYTGIIVAMLALLHPLAVSPRRCSSRASSWALTA